VEAFRATLEEVAEADVILHVRDAAHPDSEAQRADVLAVLKGMADEGTLDENYADRIIEVLNKADLIGGVDSVPRRSGSVAVSALTGEGGSRRAWSRWRIAFRIAMGRGWPGCTNMARWFRARMARMPRMWWCGSCRWIGRGLIECIKECSFLKKRTKKLLDFGVRDPAGVPTKDQKSFASFLQKRRVFLPLRLFRGLCRTRPDRNRAIAACGRPHRNHAAIS
jgi:hypothetical protein